MVGSCKVIEVVSLIKRSPKRGLWGHCFKIFAACCGKYYKRHYFYLSVPLLFRQEQEKGGHNECNGGTFPAFLIEAEAVSKLSDILEVCCLLHSLPAGCN